MRTSHTDVPPYKCQEESTLADMIVSQPQIDSAKNVSGVAHSHTKREFSSFLALNAFLLNVKGLTSPKFLNQVWLAQLKSVAFKRPDIHT